MYISFFTIFVSNFVSTNSGIAIVIRQWLRVATGAVAGARPATDLEREFGAALRDRGDTAQDTVRSCHDVMDWFHEHCSCLLDKKNMFFTYTASCISNAADTLALQDVN